MARSRNIKPGFFTNEYLAECDPLARILFSGLWCLADREGRLEDRPLKIKAELLPYDNCDPNNLLNQLVAQGFIIRYQVEGRKYIQIVNFNKHQNPHKKETESTIPAPLNTRPGNSETSPEITGTSPVNTETSPADSLLLIPDSLNLVADSFNPIINNNGNHARADDDKPACHFYQKVLGRLLNPVEIEQMNNWEDQFGRDLTQEAIKCGVKNGVLTLSYLQSIFDNWKLNNIKTVAEVIAHEEKRKAGNRSSPGKSPPVNLDQIWEQVKNKLNPYQTPEWKDLTIAKAVKHVGYSKLCEMDEQYAKRMFISAYKNALKEVG